MYTRTLPIVTNAKFTTMNLAPLFLETIRRLVTKQGIAGPLPLPPTNQRILVTFFECEVKGQYKSECSKLKNPNKRRAHAKAFVLGGGEALQDPNVVTGMFLLNNRYAYVLFDSGADRSFVSVVFSPLIDITPTALDTKYTIELAD
nr:reverse transcriptase domain-containing protein [Tanacetum cinerariifolium]